MCFITERQKGLVPQDNVNPIVPLTDIHLSSMFLIMFVIVCL